MKDNAARNLDIPTPFDVPASWTARLVAVITDRAPASPLVIPTAPADGPVTGTPEVVHVNKKCHVDVLLSLL